MGILYIPDLLHSATIEVRNQGQNSEKKLQGKILVIEDAGSSVYETLDIQDVADSRTRWLDSETHFINRMGLKQEESVLIDLVKRLYKLLFPADIRISEICESASDPER
ncbi:hypothetical protein GGH97_002303 [Coemansia sp. RSA 475]|nr:hypothetical protein GGH97_002303 [Coemansia sp. RSA 475]